MPTYTILGFSEIPKKSNTEPHVTTYAETIEHAVHIGNKLVDDGYFVHVLDDDDVLVFAGSYPGVKRV